MDTVLMFPAKDGTLFKDYNECRHYDRREDSSKAIYKFALDWLKSKPAAGDDVEATARLFTDLITSEAGAMLKSIKTIAEADVVLRKAELREEEEARNA